MKLALTSDFGLRCYDMSETTKDPNGELPSIDGGDVLYTGDSYFVGLSSRTNEAGVSWLRRNVKEDIDVHAIPLAGWSKKMNSG